MEIFILTVLGLSFGSFVNALVWRLYWQEQLVNGQQLKIKNIKLKKHDLSISKGRSMCVHCGHSLAWYDLIPVVSWVTLRGKCRYCNKPIDDSPLSELVTAVAFITSYLYWPANLDGAEWISFGIWLMITVGLVALFVYDVRWLILPNRIIFPLIGLAMLLRINQLAQGAEVLFVVRESAVGVLVGGGFFYLLFQLSKGKWIGGGDVKLGFLMGLILGPKAAMFGLMFGFYSASLFILPLWVIKKVDRKSQIPFGPFLILGLFVVMLWFDELNRWFESFFGL